MRKLEIHAEDFGIVIAMPSLVNIGLSSDPIMRLLSGGMVLFAGLLIGIGVSNPHIVVDLSLIRRKSEEK